MKNTNQGLAARLISLLAISIWAAPSRAVTTYSVQLIPKLSVFSISDTGEIVGESQNSLDYALAWNNGNFTQLTPPGLTEPYAKQANNAGQIVGGGMNSDGWWQGFLWDPQSGYINVAVPDGYITGFSSINNEGEIGGAIGPLNGGPGTAAIWTSPENLTLLPAFGDDGASVWGLNDEGDAIGNSGDVDSYGSTNGGSLGLDHAVLWKNGRVIDLTPADPWSFAAAINNEDQVIGTLIFASMDGGGAFEWDPINGMTLLAGGDGAQPMSINNQGQIVGYIPDPNGEDFLASLWDNGSLYDLNNLIPGDSGWTLEEADSINDSGQIVGEGTYDGDEYQTFLLTPIPEPAGIFLIAAIGLCMGWFQRGAAHRR